MRKHLRSATSFILVVLMFSLTLPMTLSSLVAARNVSPPQQESQQQVDLPDRLLPGVFKGEAVRRRINRLRATNKALNRAMKDKEKVGKRVNWELSAVLVFPESKKKDTAQLRVPMTMGSSFAPADQQTLSDGSGEATFITYDGPAATWDGTISVTDYYTGENRVYNGEMWDFGAPDDPSVWDVTGETYYPPDGGDPVGCGSGRELCLETKNNGPDTPSASLMVKASHAPMLKSATPGPIFRWFSRFWRCFSRTAAFIGRVCVAPQPNIRNNLICALAAGVYAAGCCARFSHQNYGQGICYP
jgi:hypothetical protein